MKAIHLLLFSQVLVLMIKICAQITSIIVFGDSSVDPGNNNYVATVAKSNFQPYGCDFYDKRPTGRFSNGRIATDFISEALGIRNIIPAYLDPHYNIVDFAKGVSFASAGTGYDNFTSSILSVIPLWKELVYYKEYQNRLRVHFGAENANKILSEALYLISIGTNDFLENYYAFPFRSTVYIVEDYENYLLGIAKNFIIDLYDLGARKISIGGLPPMGCLPLERNENYLSGKKCIQSYNRVAQDFNVKLQQLVRRLTRELGGVQLVYSDIYNILFDIIMNPQSFGFEVGERGCCATGSYEMSYMCNKLNPFTCSIANKYVFWDSMHPSEKTNFLVAEHTLKNTLAVFV
ncbi:GDSL esterase/lipase At4g26790-like [Rutidosis leptorrhynchoides]|uniref:GDSL esterase/lipase At4g26790-like n=1 Tax=Rutidosis leptorrhynchoides TaxID=125765 RepID=UPI003A99B73F